MKNNYDDIINMKHHVSKKHPKMKNSDRAAQFSPFAALTGYDDAINETSRITHKKIEMTEDYKRELDEKLMYIKQNINNRLSITVTYFVPDISKAGGKYVKYTGEIKKIDEYGRTIIFSDKKQIVIDNISEIEC